MLGKGAKVVGSVSWRCVLDQIHEVVDAVAQEFLLGVFWHTVDAVIVNDVGIDVSES